MKGKKLYLENKNKANMNCCLKTNLTVIFLLQGPTILHFNFSFGNRNQNDLECRQNKVNFILFYFNRLEKLLLNFIN